MGAISKLLSFLRGTRNGAKLSEAKINPGGGANLTAEHFAPAGDDAHPLPGDYVVHVTIPRSGGAAVVGYLDPKNEQKAAAGEKRIYSRDGGGNTVVELWLKADGSALLSNGTGAIELKPDGEIDLNGATITPEGDIISKSGISLDNHTHTGNLGSPTSAPIPTP